MENTSFQNQSDISFLAMTFCSSYFRPPSLGIVWIEKMILLLIFWYLTSMWPLEVEVCRPLDDNILLSNAGNELGLQVDNSIRQNSENELIFSKWPRTTLKYIHENWTIISSYPKYNRIGNLIFSQFFFFFFFCLTPKPNPCVIVL